MPRYNTGRKRVKWLLSKWDVDPTLKKGEDIEELAEMIAEEKKGKFVQKLSVFGFKIKKHVYSYDPSMYRHVSPSLSHVCVLCVLD